MMDNDELRRAKFSALKILNFKPRSIEELTTKLKGKNFSNEVINEVLTEFKKKGLMDDSKFSRLWVNSRMASRPKGAILLRQELEQKGVKEEVIGRVLEDVKKEYDEYEVVKGLAEERMRHLSGLDRRTAKRRLFGYLKRRGFSTDIVMKVIGESLSKTRHCEERTK